MRVLLSTGPSCGLYFPLVPMAWALRARGHDVLVASPETLAPTVTASGLSFAPSYGVMSMREVMVADRDGAPIELADDEAGLLEQVGRGFGRLAARTLPEMLEIIRWWQPDLVLGEPHAYSAGIAAAARGVPWVQHGIGMGYDPAIDRWGAKELAAELTELGFGDLPTPDLVLEPCPSLVRRSADGVASSIRYVPYEAPASLEPWMFAARRVPRLLLTLGTIAPKGRGTNLFRELLNALPGLGVELVVAVDDSVVPQLGPLPDAVVHAGWLPLATVMATCDIAVHHGGGGTTMAGIAAGIPQLLLPRLLPEQHDSARRLAQFGAALQIPDAEVETGDVITACEILLSESSFGARADDLRADNLAQPDPATRVTDLVDLVADGAARR